MLELQLGCQPLQVWDGAEAVAPVSFPRIVGDAGVVEPRQEGHTTDHHQWDTWGSEQGEDDKVIR